MKYCRYVLIAIFTFVLSALSVTFTAGDTQAEWTTAIIDGDVNKISSSRIGLYSSIAVTKLGRLDIAYNDHTNNTLKYATNRKDGWNTFTVDDSAITGLYSSLALSPPKPNTVNNNGRLRSTHVRHISYFDHENEKLMYATAQSSEPLKYSNFDIYTVDDGNGGQDSVGWYSSISTAVDIRPHIAYYDITNRNLKYAHSYDNNQGFTTETVDGDSKTEVGTYCSIVNVDANGGCYISYRDDTNNTLKCATNVNGSWIIEVVASGAKDDASGPTHNSIARDSNGNIHIAYYDNGKDKNLKYATNKSGSWVTSTVDDTVIDGADSGPYCGKYNSIAVDSSGYVHFSYYDDSSNRDGQNLKYATNRSGSWVVTTVDSTDNVGLYTSLALGFSGEVYISYYDMTHGVLKLATYTN